MINFRLICLALIALMFFVCGILLITKPSCANDYTITDYGQGVFSIEHDGVIHIQGKGEPKKEGDESPSYNYRDNKSETWDVGTYAILAEDKESEGDFYMAAIYYGEAGDTEKMRELAYKDIDEELAETPPDYQGALMTVNDILKDKELALEYYEKHLDQKLEEKNQN